MEVSNQRKPGRPPGQTKAAGYRAGRAPIVRPEAYTRRLTAWRAWWPTRPRTLTAAVLADLMNSSAGTVSNYLRSREPSEPALGNLERLCSTFGYEPPTSHHQLL